MTEVMYSRDALKALQTYRRDGQRIVEKISAYAADPASQANNVKHLKGAGTILRLRVGDYRVLLKRESRGITVIAIGPRGSIYR
jgi:mRNA interferase RelE/StbE